MFRADLFLKLARRAAGRGVSFWELYEELGDAAAEAVQAAVSLGVLKWQRRGSAKVVYTAGPAAEAMLKVGERCWVAAVSLRGRVYLNTPFGLYPVCPTPSHIASAAHKLAEACGAPYVEVHREVADAVRRALRTARGLERWITCRE